LSLTGFTLIELMLVVIVILTLSAIAIPNYTKSKNRTLEKEGIANVKLIAAAETIYKMENGAYARCNCSNAVNCSNPQGCNTLLKLMLITTNWQYDVDNSGNITASAQASSGISGCTYTLTPATYDNEPQPSGCP